MRRATQITWAIALAAVFTLAAQFYDAGAASAKEPGACYPVYAAIAAQLAEHGASTAPALDWREQMAADEPFIEALIVMTGYKSPLVRAELSYLALAVTYHAVTYDPALLEAYLGGLLVRGLMAEYMAGALDASHVLGLLPHLACGGQPI